MFQKLDSYRVLQQSEIHPDRTRETGFFRRTSSSAVVRNAHSRLRAREIRDTKSRLHDPREVTPDLASAHVPSIEGLFHGGHAMEMRHLLTAFGSGWQGVYKDVIREMLRLREHGRERQINWAHGPLLDALRRDARGKAASETISKFAQGKAKLIGYGAERVVFDIGGGKVAKIGFGSAATPLKVPEIVQPMAVRNIGMRADRLHVEIAPRVETSGVTQGMADNLRKRLMSRYGWHWSDNKPRNIGLLEGKPVILDPGYMQKSVLRRQLRTEAMRQGLDPHFVNEKLSRLAKQSHVRRPEELGPAALLEFRREITQAGKFNKQALLQRARETARSVRTASASKGAAGKVANAAARVMRSI